MLNYDGNIMIMETLVIIQPKRERKRERERGGLGGKHLGSIL
jgi:hypothetical protein